MFSKVELTIGFLHFFLYLWDKELSMNIWFISDLHFGHSSILYFHPERRMAAGISLEELQSDRKIAIQKHDEWLIKKWNDTVERNDLVYIIGDFCLSNKEETEKLLHKLKGKKYLIRGNHDKSCNGLERFFEWVGDIKEVKFNHQMFDFIDENETFCVEMCHFPMLAWNRRPNGTIMVHGHCHGSIDKFNTESLELRVDVSFDGELANHQFISLEKLYKFINEKKKSLGATTFKDYIEKKMEIDGFRM